MKNESFLTFIKPFQSRVTRKVLQVNPTIPAERTEPAKTDFFVYEYDSDHVENHHFSSVNDVLKFCNPGKNVWINIGGLRREDVNNICDQFNIHPLIAEDILSRGQRPKMDELNQLVYCLLNMLYYNAELHTVESEQISIVLLSNVVITFQEEPKRDVFNPLRDRIRIAGSKVRDSKVDYLFYSLIDLIVDNYFVVMEQLGEKIGALEEDIARKPDTNTLSKINLLRKEMILLKRNVSPVREIINGILRSENSLVEERTEKYFKDVYDHIVQANELAENYRDMMINLQDLYLSNVNLRMNEVMKVMAIVTCLLAPATVIGGIFGMNFDRLPYIHDQNGFFIAVTLMLLIPVWMIYVFKRRGWF